MPLSDFSAFFAVTSTPLTDNDSTALGTDTVMVLSSGLEIFQFGNSRNFDPSLLMVSESLTFLPFSEYVTLTLATPSTVLTLSICGLAIVALSAFATASDSSLSWSLSTCGSRCHGPCHTCLAIAVR
mgnify:CR=1 FL=1